MPDRIDKIPLLVCEEEYHANILLPHFGLLTHVLALSITSTKNTFNIVSGQVSLCQTLTTSSVLVS